ncbi:putative spermidine/putrescine transport system permease protein [Enterococcus sp. PF1-24]|uniref:ABC transporter permease n=1 Tax=unclassified Enterococcus TaxID=2608891 RepID=UPI00247470C8|nr:MULTISPECIES: ABC transporter permease [unclassified Enterococcus]MDH6363534.1 putative spermidine/putrescine transport system permease protein [Enterococcus sp. PFB1-1]MDH6400769.1 putative spermidine/putrescine transport system permease protein [Enterococcus sp. PF1-24]
MKRNVPYLIVLPGVILLLFFMILPLVNSVWPTFSTEAGFTLKSYWDFLTDDYNQTILFRTIRIALIVTASCILLGIPTAYFIAGVNKKWKSILMAVTMFPLLTNSVIRSFAWINILGKNGIVNNLLMKIGIISEPISILYTEFAIIIGSIYLFLPTMITTLIGVMENIEGETLEAAETLGASPFRAFYKIVLPLCIPGVIVGSILVFTGTMTAYTTPQLLGGNKKMMLATFLYQQASALGNWTSASMIALIMIAITLFVNKTLNFVAAKIDRRDLDHA